MKYKYLILILLCLSLQSKEQTIANNSTVDNITTSDKYVPKTKAEGGVIKAQEGTELEGLSYAEKLDRRRNELVRRRFKEQEEAAKQAQIEQAVASRNAILTYGSIGIVLLFIITAIAAFSILYVRRNKDNPKYRKP